MISSSARPPDPAPLLVVGSLPSSLSTTPAIWSAFAPVFSMTLQTGPDFSLRSDARTWSPVTSGFCLPTASAWAAASVCWAMVVNRSVCMMNLLGLPSRSGGDTEQTSLQAARPTDSRL